MTALKGIFIEL